LQTLQTRQRRPYLYKATEDAAWTSTGWTTYASTWRVKVKKVKMDGTLDTIELTKDCIGAETDPLPIASGDYCIETVTADGLRALVKYQPEPRGTKTLFMNVTLRAYLKSDDSLVDADDAFNSGTMYLFPTYDWERWP